MIDCEEIAELGKPLADAASSGHALFWPEVKLVGLISQLLSDFGVAHVVDLSPASGAVVAAAAMNGITCDAFCFNDMHKKWLEGVLDRAMLAVLTNAEVANHDKGFSDDIQKYFASSIEDAEQLLSLDSQSTDEPAKKKPRKKQGEPQVDDEWVACDED